MSPLHRSTLYGLLGLLGVSLLLPGLMELFKPGLGAHWLIAAQTDARSHLRALNAMMAALGLIALWACLDLTRARALVLALGIVMACVAAARLVSLWLDGWPGRTMAFYFLVEALMAGVFLFWPPPKL